LFPLFFAISASFVLFAVLPDFNLCGCCAMLVELSIQNIAIIDRLRIAFEPGMNALTGSLRGDSGLVGSLVHSPRTIGRPECHFEALDSPFPGNAQVARRPIQASDVTMAATTFST
jgi:hypothetical protein